LLDNSINYFNACKHVFFDRWLEKKDSSFILNALNNMKRNANETMDEFNLKFEKIIQDIP